MRIIPYRRMDAFKYAEKWAMSRNPQYMNFDNTGGDCTNFASQCLYAGSGVMNYTKDIGWYYISPTNRAAAWTGVQYFYKFIVNNKGVGPFGYEAGIDELEIGDFIQLFNGTNYYHTLIIVGHNGNVPLVAAHMFDAFMRPLDSYVYVSARGIKISGVRE